MQGNEIWDVVLLPWVILPLVFFFWISILLTVKKYGFRTLKALTAKTKTNLDDLLIASAELPVTILIFASGAMIVERLMPVMTQRELTNVFLLVFKASTIVAIIMFADRFLSGVLTENANRIDILRSTGGLMQVFVRALVIGLGVLILLDSFGVSITPVLASLGISSLAIALALQPTLESLFAGIQIVVDKPFQLGHFIQLETGEQGYVHKVGWRSTWVRMLPNNIVILPNKTLVNSKIVNYYYPDTEMAVLVEIGVHYSSDLEKVERVTVEVARETLKEVQGGVGSFAPFIRYHTFGDSSINFSVILRAREFTDNYLIKHEFIKRLHMRYAREGITIPYPIRAINYDQEKVAAGGKPVIKGPGFEGPDINRVV